MQSAVVSGHSEAEYVLHKTRNNGLKQSALSEMHNPEY